MPPATPTRYVASLFSRVNRGKICNCQFDRTTNGYMRYFVYTRCIDVPGGLQARRYGVLMAQIRWNESILVTGARSVF